MAQAQQLATQEVAVVLNVERRFVLELIASGALAAVRHENDWLVDVDALAGFKMKRDADRREGLRELTRMTEEFRGYDRER